MDETHYNSLPHLLEQIIQFGSTQLTGVLHLGDQLLSILLLIQLGCLGIQNMFHRSLSKTLTQFIGLIISWGVCSFALHEYRYLMNQIHDGFNQIITEYLRLDSNLVYITFAQQLQLLQVLVDPQLEQTSSSWNWSQFTQHYASIQTYEFIEHIGIGLIIFSSTLCFSSYVYAQALFSFTAILGPILIPWLLIPPLKIMTENWLRLAITAGLQKTITLLVMALFQPSLTQMLAIAQSIAIKGSTSFQELKILHLGNYVLLTALSLSMVILIWQAPKMIRVLVPPKS